MSDAGAREGIAISVQILLPEAIDRRFDRRIAELEGASWPDWGGHITLVPSFVPRAEVEDIIARVSAVCEQTDPFRLRLGEPDAYPDPTRPGYQAVFLTIPETDEEIHDQVTLLHDRLLYSLVGVREHLNPELASEPFLPHVTLAMSLGESEALRMVRALRTDGMRAEFHVDEVWVMIRRGSGESSRLDRVAIQLGPPQPVGLLSD